MRNNIIPPKKVVRGKFSVRISFARPIQALTPDNIILLGDDQISYTIQGNGSAWVLQISIPSDAVDSLQITLTGHITQTDNDTPQPIESKSVVVHYDTRRNTEAAFGEPLYRSDGKIAVPITFTDAVIGLSKKNIDVQFSQGKGKYQLYGTDNGYEIVLCPARNSQGMAYLSLRQSIEKENGITVPIKSEAIDVRYPKRKGVSE